MVRIRVTVSVMARNRVKVSGYGRDFVMIESVRF